MYCSRRGREVSRPTDICKRCGRCNWEQNPNSSKPERGSLVLLLLFGTVMLLAAALLFMR